MCTFFNRKSSLKTIICTSSEYFVVDNGALFTKNLSILLCFPPASSTKFFSLPSNLKTVSSSAFIGCRNILSIHIPDNSVQTIRSYAFANCSSLQSLNIPLSVSQIESNAFVGCNNLRCGVLIENRNKLFIRNLVDNGKLNPTAVKECSYITCREINYHTQFNVNTFVYVFILM